MDIARAPRKKTGRNVAIGVGAVGLVAATIALSSLDPAAPAVQRVAILIDSVRQGDVVREVRGPGTLVPEQIRFITAQASARVDRKSVESGDRVGAGQVLLEMSNPDLQIQTMQAEQQVRQAQIELLNLRTNLRSAILTQEGTVAQARTQQINTAQEALAADSLRRRNLISSFELNNRKAQAEEAEIRYRVERERLDLLKASIDSQIATQTGQVAQLEAIAERQRNRLGSLSVRAPESGVLQDLTLQLGQWVPEGTTLAKVVQPGRLKAVLRIPESQAKDVVLGQPATIDTRNGIVKGRVIRKDPAAIQGTVTVDVSLDGPLPAGAVPDLSVDGTIQIEKLVHVIYTGRPAFGAANGQIGLFKLTEDGDAAIRVPVTLGRTSVNTVEILGGLAVGDKVILSDMTQYAAADRVRIK
ncbi:MAG: HlyD family efflux transporter periplasmic adaptor subunit [Gemmatimonadaceae bacterium]|nr:HlyD family efflux transporter periplasmic adaptor subunit [Gemmatimonadaceae bacterium]